MSPTPRLVRLAVLPALLSLALGCNSKDESTNPVDVGGTTGSGLEDISGSAVGALGFLDEFVTEVEALAAADFSNVTIDITANADALGGPRERLDQDPRRGPSQHAAAARRKPDPKARACHCARRICRT